MGYLRDLTLIVLIIHFSPKQKLELRREREEAGQGGEERSRFPDDPSVRSSIFSHIQRPLVIPYGRHTIPFEFDEFLALGLG